MTKSLGLHPAERNAQAIAWSETAGGAALALGAGTPAAAAALIAGQVTAMRTVHLRNGPWNSSGGYEYNLVLIAALTAVAADGPGPISVDALLRRSRWGDVVGLLALAGGVAASYAVTELAKRAAPDPDAPAADGAATDAPGD